LGSLAPPRGSTAVRNAYGIPTPMRFSTEHVQVPSPIAVGDQIDDPVLPVPVANRLDESSIRALKVPTPSQTDGRDAALQQCQTFLLALDDGHTDASLLG
jgi:hypothetical protein